MGWGIRLDKPLACLVKNGGTVYNIVKLGYLAYFLHLGVQETWGIERLDAWEEKLKEHTMWMWVRNCPIWKVGRHLYTNYVEIAKKEQIAHILLCQSSQTTKQQSKKEVIIFRWFQGVGMEVEINKHQKKEVPLPMAFLVLVEGFLQLGMTQGGVWWRCFLLILCSLCPQQVQRAHEYSPSTLLSSRSTPWFGFDWPWD